MTHRWLHRSRGGIYSYRWRSSDTASAEAVDMAAGDKEIRDRIRVCDGMVSVSLSA